MIFNSLGLYDPSDLIYHTLYRKRACQNNNNSATYLITFEKKNESTVTKILILKQVRF